MVRPVKGTGLEVRGGSLNQDVGVERHEPFLRIGAVRRRCLVRYLVIDDNEDFDALFSFTFQEVV